MIWPNTWNITTFDAVPNLWNLNDLLEPCFPRLWNAVLQWLSVTTGDENRQKRLLELQGPTYVQEIWNFSTNDFTININLWWMITLISFPSWENDGVVYKKFLLSLNSLWVSPYANGKVAWVCLRWLCRPDLLKWELKPHFKGLLSRILFASAQAHCPHAGHLRSWEGVVWFHETCCCQCRWRNATLWVYGSSNSVFCLPHTNSQLHAYLWTVISKGEKIIFWLSLKYKWGLFLRYLLIYRWVHSLASHSSLDKGIRNDSVVIRDGDGGNVFPHWLLRYSFIEHQ